MQGAWRFQERRLRKSAAIVLATAIAPIAAAEAQGIAIERIEAIERQIGGLQSELRRLKSELGETKQQLLRLPEFALEAAQLALEPADLALDRFDPLDRDALRLGGRDRCNRRRKHDRRAFAKAAFLKSPSPLHGVSPLWVRLEDGGIPACRRPLYSSRNAAVGVTFLVSYRR